MLRRGLLVLAFAARSPATRRCTSPRAEGLGAVGSYRRYEPTAPWRVNPYLDIVSARERMASASATAAPPGSLLK
jgi:hypothetical protein